MRHVDPAWLRREVGARVRKRRLRAKMTQGVCAGLTGVGRVHLSNVERAVHLPSLPLLYSLADIFDCHIKDLLPPGVEL